MSKSKLITIGTQAVGALVLLAPALVACNRASAAEEAGKPMVGLIPRAPRAIVIDGRLEEWNDAFATPIHIGHPEFANRGAHFLYLWDDQNLYIGLLCQDQRPAHVAPDNRLYDGDAVEFYLDVRRGQQLGGPDFGPGTLHMFYTGFTGTEVKPRWAIRDLPAFRNVQLKGVEVGASKTAWGYTIEFKLPWTNFPDFQPRPGAAIGIDCELCSSDGGPRVDRTFVYSSPTSVSTPATFGRVQLVDRCDPAALRTLGRALLPLSLTKSANYDWMYGAAGISPTIAPLMARIEGRVIDGDGKVRKVDVGTRRTREGSGMTLWSGKWELFDLPPGAYSLELVALDRDNRVICSRTEKFLHREPSTPKVGQNPSPMVEHARSHPRLKETVTPGRREPLTNGTLFLPAAVETRSPVPLVVHFHGGHWLPQAAAGQLGTSAIITVQLGSGSGVYARAFQDGKAFTAMIEEAESRLGVRFDPISLSAWSAGYGAIREILKTPEHYARVRSVILIDALHAGYVNSRPGPKESHLVATDLEVFVRFARDAAEGKKDLLVTHSEVFPGTFASTTETADYLLKEVGVQRKATLEWGPAGMQQLSEASRAGFRVLGFAGNSAPDHVDHLHALPDFLLSAGMKPAQK